MYEELDQRYMQRALEMAKRGSEYVAPNPMVGAVIVHNGVIIGEGWHHQYGDVHAEVDCLNNVPAARRHLIPESTMYVTLEPCAHTGKQPPCASRIVQEGIKKVVVCNDDPFEKVKGRGYKILMDAGVEVVRGISASRGFWLNRRFFTFQQLHRPYVILKWAQSADGAIAPQSRQRTAISNHYSHTQSHRWRAEEGAIAVGYNTALHDNPQLTARHWKGRNPLRIVADRQPSLPATHALLDRSTETWVFNTMKSSEEKALRFIRYNDSDELPPVILEALAAQNVTSVIIEGGGAFLTSFIAANLWDEARVFSTRKGLGGGIAAPILQHAALAFTTDIAGDRLLLFQNISQPFACPYVAGMEI